MKDTTTTPGPSKADETRKKAEKFLRSLPPGTQGILVTSRGGQPISDNTMLADELALMELYKFSRLEQASTAMRQMQAILEKQMDQKENETP